MTDRPLRILQVSTADRAGGAERSAWNLFEAYRARGHASWLAVGYKQGDDPDVSLIPRIYDQIPWRRYCRTLRERLEPYHEVPGVWRMRRWLDAWENPRREIEKRLGIEDFNYPGSHRLLTLPPQRPDIVHCHNLHGNYFDLRILPWLSRDVPVIVNLRDAWLLSGHCSHSFDCERWKTGCGHCPDLNIFPAINRDATAHNWRRKQKIYAQSSLYVTTPCEWLMRRVHQSILAPAVVESRVIPNAVDLSVFHPTNKEAVRSRLGIPPNARVILSSAHGIRRNPFKDFETMRTAIALVADQMRGEQLMFIALGEEAPDERIGEAKVYFVPFKENAEIVASYSQAADLYIHAARAEVWGLTITEALACGTPVVATAVGGIPDQVKSLANADQGQQIAGLKPYGASEATGILVPVGNARAMAVCINRLLRDDPLRWLMGQNAARDAVKRFGLHRQADDFLSWYREIIKDFWAHRKTKLTA